MNIFDKLCKYYKILATRRCCRDLLHYGEYSFFIKVVSFLKSFLDFRCRRRISIWKSMSTCLTPLMVAIPDPNFTNTKILYPFNPWRLTKISYQHGKSKTSGRKSKNSLKKNKHIRRLEATFTYKCYYRTKDFHSKCSIPFVIG